MDFEDQQQEADHNDHEEEEEEEEPEPISIASSEPVNFMINHLHDTKSTRPIAVFDPHAPPPHRGRPRFKECLKNHAVGIGGHTVDGCGEFMPAGDDGTLESLRCAACGCHRNFHRKETIPHGGAYLPNLHAPPRQQQQQLLIAHAPHGHLFGNNNKNNNNNSRGGPPSGYLVAAAPPHQRAAPPHLALPSSSGGTGDEDEIYLSTPGGSTTSGGSGSRNNNSNKRYRTKFTQDQKDKMLQFASRLDWKIQKQDEEIVQRFCEEVGVKRHVLKVWMHNNKQTLGGKKT